MRSIHWFMILAAFIGFFSSCQCKAQSPDSSKTPARYLDSLLQDYAYRALVHPRTGTPYDAKVPSNITGIKISVLRLRNGSLRIRGFRSYKEFQIPIGIVVQPYVQRLAFVYQNLGNWSSIYYPLPGYSYLTPVLGLLAYNTANLSATDLPELSIVASKSPISITFTNVSQVPSGSVAQCVWFDLDGLPEFRDLVSSSVCSTYRQGHFAIVANSTEIALSPAPSENPSPGPSTSKGSNSKAWKIVGGVVGGFVVLVLLALLLTCIIRYRRERKVTKMQGHADVGEALGITRVGNAQAPVATGTRTQPLLENEYVA